MAITREIGEQLAEIQLTAEELQLHRENATVAEEKAEAAQLTLDQSRQDLVAHLVQVHTARSLAGVEAAAATEPLLVAYGISEDVAEKSATLLSGLSGGASGRADPLFLFKPRERATFILARTAGVIRQPELVLDTTNPRVRFSGEGTPSTDCIQRTYVDGPWIVGRAVHGIEFPFDVSDDPKDIPEHEMDVDKPLILLGEKAVFAAIDSFETGETPNATKGDLDSLRLLAAIHFGNVAVKDLAWKGHVLSGVSEQAALKNRIGLLKDRVDEYLAQERDKSTVSSRLATVQLHGDILGPLITPDEMMDIFAEVIERRVDRYVKQNDPNVENFEWFQVTGMLRPLGLGDPRVYTVENISGIFQDAWRMVTKRILNVPEVLGYRLFEGVYPSNKKVQEFDNRLERALKINMTAAINSSHLSGRKKKQLFKKLK